MRVYRTSRIQNFKFPLQLVYVVAPKDFDTFIISLNAAIENLQNYEIHRILVVVPKNSLKQIRELLAESKDLVEIIDEEDFISLESREMLKAKFKNRYGWVLQQFLKIEAVLSMPHHNSIVVDSDTILLRPRNWIDSAGNQILLPTEESHQQYYLFLEELGLKVDRNFSFISHHMVFQPQILLKCLSEIGVESTSELINLVCRMNYPDYVESYFSIDYEMYGQYLLNYHPHHVHFERWANIDVNGFPSGQKVPVRFKGAMSFSAHSWKR